MATTASLPRGLSLSRARPVVVTTPAAAALPPCRAAFSTTPSLGATMIRRPRRPYTFTQLVQLSDGSTYTIRTTSPLALYKSTKDTRNHVLWQPNDKSLRNVEVDEAGKLAAFRSRFGRSWDVDSGPAAAAAGGEETAKRGRKTGKGVEEEKDAGDEEDGAEAKPKEAAAASKGGDMDSLADLISGYSTAQAQTQGGNVVRKKK